MKDYWKGKGWKIKGLLKTKKAVWANGGIKEGKVQCPSNLKKKKKNSLAFGNLYIFFYIWIIESWNFQKPSK